MKKTKLKIETADTDLSKKKEKAEANSILP